MAQIGYNNNVRYRDRAFHIQTEDSGARTTSIVTHLFVDGGRILSTMKASYADRAGEADLINVVKALMKAQHKAMFSALREGQFDAELGDSAAIPARPSQMPPASIEPIETVTVRSEPPDSAVVSPRARDTLVVHPPGPPSLEPPPDTARAPIVSFDTLRPVPPSVSRYRSVNPPQAIDDRGSRRLTERTERASIFRSSAATAGHSTSPPEATAALDEVILAFLSS